MAAGDSRIGIIGGSGMLGRTIARALLDRGGVAPGDLWIANRSGTLAGDMEGLGVKVTADNQALTDACDMVVLSVPPAQAGRIGIDARDRLVVSVMAGVTLEELRELTGARRVVRAMSSPAAELGLAYSPWVAGQGLEPGDRERVAALFGACGLTNEVPGEDQIDVFTALTGPVPGFVAYFASCMADYATAQGIAPQVADRAMRQLFLAAGRMMAEGAATPADHVRGMIDYAGTTAAGLTAMQSLPIARDIAAGLDASVAKSRQIR